MAFGVLLPLLLSQVGVGVVVAEPWPVLIPFPTDWRVSRKGRSALPARLCPGLQDHTSTLCQRPEHPPTRVQNRREGARRGEVSGPHSLSLPPSSERLTITDIRLVSVLQGSGVLAFPETPDAICLGEKA